jgi:hypothetical protein
VKIPAPKSLQEIDFGVAESILKTSEGESFLIADSGSSDGPNRIAIFATNAALQLLSLCFLLFVDGTFFVTPLLFYQLLSIHCLHQGKYFPAVFALVPNKEKATSQRVFHMLASALAARGFWVPNDPWTTFVSDFEVGLQVALSECFGSAASRGCFFHFAQCIWRFVNGKGWRSLYKSNEHFCLRVKMIIAMGMVPAEEKLRILHEAQSFLRMDEQIVVLLDSYFVHHWVERVPFGLWTWYNVQVQTNNHVEGWHSGLKKKFPHGHPLSGTSSRNFVTWQTSPGQTSIFTIWVGEATRPASSMTL